MSEQRKSNWRHPNTYYRQREETQHSATDECDTSGHPQPSRALRTKAVQIIAYPGRDVVLEAIHFLVEIGNPRHPRLSGMHSIRSYECHAVAIQPLMTSERAPAVKREAEDDWAVESKKKPRFRG